MRHCPYCFAEVSARFCPKCGKEADKAQNNENTMPVGHILKTNHGLRSYEIGAALGQGGFGITYAAWQREDKRRVAIKEYFPTRCAERRSDHAVVAHAGMQEVYLGGVKSFLKEAQMLKALENVPSAVNVLDFFEGNGTAYLVMEFLEGKALQKKILELPGGRFEPAQLFRAMLPLVNDLRKMHDNGIIHRDIAPDNILWMADDTLKLIDFGAARSMENGKSMTVMLKPGFAPVEQYQSRGQGCYTDIYALCATMYYCLSGEMPPGSLDRLQAVSNQEPDPLQSLCAKGVNLLPEVDRVIRWGMMVQPVYRPENLEKFISKLIPAVDPYLVEEPGAKQEFVRSAAPQPAPVPQPQPDPTRRQTYDTIRDTAPEFYPVSDAVPDDRVNAAPVPLLARMSTPLKVIIAVACLVGVGMLFLFFLLFLGLLLG